MKKDPIVWRGITLHPDRSGDGSFRSERTPIGDSRTADWKVMLAGSSWYGRLRVGSDRFPGRGETPQQALDEARAEAYLIARFIKAMLPKGGK